VDIDLKYVLINIVDLLL